MPAPRDEPAGQPADDAPLNPASVAVEQLARLLGLTAEDVRQHVADGAPTNADGSIHLVHYAAWLNAPGSADAGERDTNGGR